MLDLEKEFTEKELEIIGENIQEDIERRIDHAIKHIRANKSYGGISAIDQYIRDYQSKLPDIEIIIAALKEIESQATYTRECRRAIRAGQAVRGNNLFGNIEKVNKLLEKRGYKTIDLDITPTIKRELVINY